MLPHQFAGDRVKISFIISLLSGKARQWAEALWNSESPVIESLDSFITHFKVVFGTCTSALSVHDKLFRLLTLDYKLIIHEYTLQFRTLVASSGWNEIALLSAY